MRNLLKQIFNVATFGLISKFERSSQSPKNDDKVVCRGSNPNTPLGCHADGFLDSQPIHSQIMLEGDIEGQLENLDKQRRVYISDSGAIHESDTMSQQELAEAAGILDHVLSPENVEKRNTAVNKIFGDFDWER